MNQLKSERDYWRNATRRKTTLFSNTAVGGNVSFPVDQNIQFFKLIVPIDTTTIEFDFKQKPVVNQWINGLAAEPNTPCCEGVLAKLFPSGNFFTAFESNFIALCGFVSSATST